VEHGGLPSYFNELSVTINTAAPTAGILNFPEFTDSCVSASDRISNDHNFSLSLGGQEAGGSVAYQISTDGGNSWSTTTASQSNLANGSYQFRIQVTDLAGNMAYGAMQAVTIDATAPSAAQLLNVNETPKDHRSNDYITNLKRPTIAFRAEVGASIQAAPTPVDPNNYFWAQEEINPGPYSMYAYEDPSDGTYAFTVIDAAGNDSIASEAITVGTTFPVITGITVIDSSVDLAFNESLPLQPSMRYQNLQFRLHQ